MKKIFNNIKYILLTIFLSIFLFVPFILKSYNHNFEIYPSIIMPSGASLVKKTGSINFTSYELYGKKDGRLYKIDIKKFLEPIPAQYFYAMRKSEFGFEPTSEEFDFLNYGLTFRTYNRFDSGELKTTQNFYRNKLQKLNFDDSLFIYREYLNTIENSKVLKSLLYEKYYKIK